MWVLADSGVCSSVECVFLNMKTDVVDDVEAFQGDSYNEGRDIVEAFIKSMARLQMSLRQKDHGDSSTIAHHEI